MPEPVCGVAESEYRGFAQNPVISSKTGLLIYPPVVSDEIFPTIIVLSPWCENEGGCSFFGFELFIEDSGLD